MIETLEKTGVGFEAGPWEPDKGRPTLVMIHGAGGCSQLWSKQMEGLKEAVNPLALDLPGHGRTEAAVLSSISDLADWVVEILGVIFPEPVVLMGHSMGGAIALEIALRYPQQAKALILVGAGPRLQVAPAFIEGFSKRFEETIDMVIGYAFAQGADLSLIREGARWMKEAGPDVVRENFLACDRFDRREDIKGLKLPCLIICGEEDKLTPPKLSKTLNDSISGSELRILPNAGHFVMMESPETFNQAVRDFVAGI